MRSFAWIVLSLGLMAVAADLSAQVKPPSDAEKVVVGGREYAKCDVYLSAHADTALLLPRGLCGFEFQGWVVSSAHYEALCPITAQLSNLPEQVSGLSFRTVNRTPLPEDVGHDVNEVSSDLHARRYTGGPDRRVKQPSAPETKQTVYYRDMSCSRSVCSGKVKFHDPDDPEIFRQPVTHKTLPEGYRKDVPEGSYRTFFTESDRTQWIPGPTDAYSPYRSTPGTPWRTVSSDNSMRGYGLFGTQGYRPLSVTPSVHPYSSRRR